MLRTPECLPSGYPGRPLPKGVQALLASIHFVLDETGLLSLSREGAVRSQVLVKRRGLLYGTWFLPEAFM
jgi:hypothetical protein